MIYDTRARIIIEGFREPGEFPQLYPQNPVHSENSEILIHSENSDP